MLLINMLSISLCRFLGPTGIKMVTNCLPLFYVRPDEHGHESITKRPLPRLPNELVRSSSTPALNEQLYDYARDYDQVLKHDKVCQQNTDITAGIVASSISKQLNPASGPPVERRPMPKPRKNQMKRSRSEANIVDTCDELYDEPYGPYEAASVTFNDSAEKLCRDNGNPPTSGELPPAPHTFELHFHSHSGWLVKLSKQKG